MDYTINNRPLMLCEGDTVTFTVPGQSIRYIVKDDYLKNTSGSNVAIFEALSLATSTDTSAMEAFLLLHYGYSAGGGDWPTYETEDYAAITRVVNALYSFISGGEAGVTPTFDMAARVPFERMVSDGFKVTINMIKESTQAISASDIAAALKLHKIQGFHLDDVRNILEKLSQPPFEFLDWIEGDTYIVRAERKSHLQYLHAKRNGLDCNVQAKEHELVPKILKYCREAPASVPLDKLIKVFGRENEVIAIVENLVSRGYLRTWEKGVYTRPEYASDISEIIAESVL